MGETGLPAGIASTIAYLHPGPGLPGDPGCVRLGRRPLRPVLHSEPLRCWWGRLGRLRRHQRGGALLGRGGPAVRRGVFDENRFPQPPPLQRSGPPDRPDQERQQRLDGHARRDVRGVRVWRLLDGRRPGLPRRRATDRGSAVRPERWYGRARQCSWERRRRQRGDEFNERVDHRVGRRVDGVDYGPTGTGPGSNHSPARGLNCVQPVNQPMPGSPDDLVATDDSNDCAGYLVVTTSGAVSAFGGAVLYGSLQGRHLNVVAIAVTPDSEGYWLLTTDGAVFAFGDAKSYGAPGSLSASAPAVGISATPDGKGYWVVTRAGDVYAFGDAASYGSLLGHRLNQPIVGMAATPTGYGYWLAAADGGVFGFGDAIFHGSMGDSHSEEPGHRDHRQPQRQRVFPGHGERRHILLRYHVLWQQRRQPAPRSGGGLCPFPGQKRLLPHRFGRAGLCLRRCYLWRQRHQAGEKRQTLRRARHGSAAALYMALRPVGISSDAGDGRDHLFADGLEDAGI